MSEESCQLSDKIMPLHVCVCVCVHLVYVHAHAWTTESSLPEVKHLKNIMDNITGVNTINL